MITFRQPFQGEYPITQAYAESIPGVTVGAAHTGIDYGCPKGTEILASSDGEVMFAGWDPTGYGLCVIIRHSSDRSTLYAHLSKIHISKGDKVRQGQPIGLSGSSGYATGPHLHFEARYRWDDYKSHFDPMKLPLMSFADYTGGTVEIPASAPQKLKEPDQLGELVKVVCTDGANAFKQDWTYKLYGFPQGTQLHFTGKTAERNGYTYCEVYEEPPKYWVAVHNEDTQILDNTE